MNLIQWLYIIISLQVQIKIATSEQNAGYYCLADIQYDDLIHIDFQLDRAGEPVNYVYAQNATDNTPLPDCSPKYDPSSNVYHMRITVNTTSHEQISPSSPCGVLFSGNMYTVKLKAFASEGLISDSDSLFTIRCESSIESSTVGTVKVGNIEHISLIGIFLKSTLEVLVSPDWKAGFSANIGDKVKLKFTLTFTGAKENVDIIGARLVGLTVAPTNNFQPINRTMMDSDGCPVNHSQNVLEVSGPFETESNGTSPFIAYSPEFEIARFVDYPVLHFRVDIEYCFTLDCFQNMCSNRKKRALDDSNSKQIVTQSQLTVFNPYSEDSLNSQNSPCYSSTTFVAIVSTLLGLILLEGLVLLFEAKKLQIVKTKVSPSQSISFEKVPLCDSEYKNPVNGYHPPKQHNIGHFVM
ncbi:uncharacterized protein LOC127732583 [Mytilus californianus]|uniref:uncharacterized protein LOC127732583 n=1 Tax=Mytilus californianus TaxID=6549 RepID=UPI002245556F|nr:uncharacterized protein LOC127732583 [Mytilus californianus]